MVPLLASRVPNLELDGRIVHCQSLREERRPDRRFLELEELALDESEHQAGLPRSHIAEKDELGVEVVVADGRHGN